MVTLNGSEIEDTVPVRMHAADFLRHRQGMTGVHVGCEQGVCGMCTVLVDGQAIKSCIMLAAQLDGAVVRTVESLAEGDQLSRLQSLFKKHHAVQCGFCTSGFLMLALSLADRTPPPSRQTIREEISGVLCRCTGYEGILRAVEEYLGCPDDIEGSAADSATVHVPLPPREAQDGCKVDRYIGQSPPRKEDDRLLCGDGQFVDDVQFSLQLEMAVARCPFPHVRIKSIDISKAAVVAGVKHILTGAEVRDLSDPLTVLRPVPGAPKLSYYALAQERATYEGQPVVSIAASSRAAAEDAIELLEIEYEPLPHVSDPLDALEDTAPVMHSDVLASNLLSRSEVRGGDPEKQLSDADLVVSGQFRVNRVSPLPMEPRGVIATWRPGARDLMVHSSTQVPHLVRKQLAESLRLDEGSIRVSASDVGGAFGMKLGVYPEDVLACLHAMATRRPVKWIEDGLEFFRASTHGRGAVHHYTIGARNDGRIVALKNKYTTDLGGWNSSFGSAQLSSVVFAGPYKVADGSVERSVALTNRTPIGAYRGYGQPEVNFALEVLIDRLARKLNADPLMLRQQNMLAPEDLPWTTPSGVIYDSGDYLRTLQMAADAVDYSAHRLNENRQRPDGRFAGIGLASFVERTGYASARFLAHRGSQYGAHESVTLRANRTGGVDLYTGVSTFGQSSETAFAQVCADVLGVDFDCIHVHAGDTAASPLNTGAFASRTIIAASGAIKQAGEEFLSKTLRLGAAILEAPVEEIVVDGRVVRHISDHERQVPLSRVFSGAILGQGIPAGDSPGLEASASFEPAEAAFSFGTAAAVVSVDAESGEFSVERFIMVHDCGTQINPLLVEGQVRGAVVQGLGAALNEELRYDPETGQLINGTMMDYFAPMAADVPPIELLHTEEPSPTTTFGVRGVGEVGTIPPAAAVANAICDALSDFGVEISELPITPETVWRALHGKHLTTTMPASPDG